MTAIDTSLGQPVASPVMTTTNDQIREIQDRDAEGRGRVIDAAYQATPSQDLAFAEFPRIVEAAMMELAAVWREQAAWWLASGKRGSKGTAAELTQAAGRLAGFAVGLLTRPVQMPVEFRTEDPLTGEPLPPEAVVPEPIASGLPCGHPVEALSTSKHTSAVTCTACGAKVGALQRHEGLVDLTGVSPETNQYTEAFQDAVSAELTKLERESADVQAAPSAPSIIDNPFTSPNAPGAGARPPVAALPYAVLPVIASQLAPRTQLSHSFVETFEGCSLRSMLERASRHNLIGPRRPGWSLIGGNAFHAAVEEIERDVVAHPGRIPVSSRGINLTGSDVVIVDVDAVFVAALDAAVKAQADGLTGSAYADPATWYASNSGKEGYDWWRVEGALMLHRYLEYHDAQFRSYHTVLRLQPLNSIAAQPVIEQEFVTSIAPDAGSGTSALTTKGFIDIVWLQPPLTNPEGHRLIVADWKTGSRRPTSTFQLGEYAHALTTLLPAGLADAEIVGSYWLARKGEYTPQVPLLAKHPADEMIYRYRQAALGSSLGLAAPHVTDMCTACGVKDYCPAQATR